MSVRTFLHSHTMLRCDIHGFVSGRIFMPKQHDKAGCLVQLKYGISYCCGTKYTNKPPVKMWDKLLVEMDATVDPKRHRR